MKRILRKGVLAGIAAFAAVLWISSPVFADEDYTPEEIQEYSENCLICHDQMANSLKTSPHALTGANNRKGAVDVGCISCHDGWKNHMDDPSVDNIVSGPDTTAIFQAEICSGCHQTPHQVSMTTNSAHAIAGLQCSSCHQIHNNTHLNLVNADREDFCGTCHPATIAEFKLRSAHPLESHNIKCVDCHDIKNIKSSFGTRGIDWTCQSCHPEKSGPFLYEHPVVYNHLVEGEGCTECHRTHGSANDNLLTQPGNGTCMQCHGMPAGHATAHSGFVAQTDCVVCHSEIHGSYDNSLFLDPNLPSKFVANCYASGCHSNAVMGGN